MDQDGRPLFHGATAWLVAHAKFLNYLEPFLCQRVEVIGTKFFEQSYKYIHSYFIGEKEKGKAHSQKA
jgi:hypothetical protein